MRAILRHRGLRLIFVANLISMMGSGMNAAAVFWQALQITHSEVTLGNLLVLQTLPALALLPFSGVIIDREDRRRLVMLLDCARGLIVLAVALVALSGRLRLWHLYLMYTLVSAGFWMFWPTINALVHELTPDSDFVSTNTLLLAAVQGGFLIAGSFVGFLYDHIGLGWILIIDFSTYVVSFLCYFGVRKGRTVVAPPPRELAHEAAGEWEKYWHEMREGLRYLRERPYLMLLGTSWALFLAALLTQGAVTAPLSARILHGGAVGYGWLTAGWGVGAFLSVFYTPQIIRRISARGAAGVSLAVLALGLALLPFSRWLMLAVAIYIVVGSARGMAGTAITSEVMERVPKHFMGRVQNTFYFFGTLLQLGLAVAVAGVAHRSSLTAAFAIVGLVYLAACVAAAWPHEAIAGRMPAGAAVE